MPSLLILKINHKMWVQMLKAKDGVKIMKAIPQKRQREIKWII